MPSIGFVEFERIEQSTHLTEYLTENIVFINNFDIVLCINDVSIFDNSLLTAIPEMFYHDEFISSVLVEKELGDLDGGTLTQSEKDILTLCQRSDFDATNLPKIDLNKSYGISFTTDIFHRHIASYLYNCKKQDICYKSLDTLLAFLTTCKSSSLHVIDGHCKN